MELSKQELQNIILDAIRQDRNERDKQLVDKAINMNDLESPAYNTNQLFREVQGGLKAQIEAIESEYPLHRPSAFDMSVRWEAQERMKALIYAAFSAKNSRYIQPGYRRMAQQLYQELIKAWVPYFADYQQREYSKQKEVKK